MTIEQEIFFNAGIFVISAWVAFVLVISVMER